MGIFDNDAVGNAKTFESSKYFQKGLYLVAISKIKYLQQRGEKVVIECKVLGAQSDDPRAPEVGETAAQVISNLDANDEKRDYALGDLKAFLNAVAGPAAADFTPQEYTAMLKQLVGVPDFGGSLVMFLECWPKEIKSKPGSYITIMRWHGRATPEHYAQFGLQAPA